MKQKSLFFESRICKSRKRCWQCRMNREYREGIASTFDVPDVDFDCPFGVEPDSIPESERGPFAIQMARSVSKAVVDTVVGAVQGKKVITEQDESSKRLLICESCEHYDAECMTCRVCGCLMRVKTKQMSAKCPQKKW